MGSINVGPAAVNKLTIDQAGKTVLTASDDGTIKCIDLTKQQPLISSHLFNNITSSNVPVKKVCTNNSYNIA